MSNRKWTTADIPDLTGKKAIVTGGNSGLGFETGLALASKGAEVFIACRNLDKGAEARSKMLGKQPEAVIHVMKLDLADLSSVTHFCETFTAEQHRLDILVNNAGIMMPPYELTKDGFESQMGTNHLGHFALTAQLLPVIISSPGCRVVNVSSLAHKSGGFDFDNLLFENGEGYGKMKAYGRSKLANLLFCYGLQSFFESNKIDAISVAAHPGASMTNLFTHMISDRLLRVIRPLASLFVQPASMGALPQLRAATDPNVKGGTYYGPDGLAQFKGYPVQVSSNALSHNKQIVQRLWEESERLTKVRFY